MRARGTHWHEVVRISAGGSSDSDTGVPTVGPASKRIERIPRNFLVRGGPTVLHCSQCVAALAALAASAGWLRTMRQPMMTKAAWRVAR